KGAGIVFCGGGASMLRQVMAQIIYLRETLGCTLPIEVMHLGEAEMTAGWRAALEALPDTRVVDLYSLVDPLTERPVTRPAGAFTHVKPAAVLLSSFEEVIFLDTNNYAMLDPTELLDRDQYRRDGYLMWSDLWLSTSIAHEYAVYSLLQVPPPPGFENSESGVMYWDKRRRWRELVTAWALMTPLAARGTIHGDKQVYGFAFAATGQ
ncbi:alpha-mannosyltransferase, partial [Tribonema minus]